MTTSSAFILPTGDPYSDAWWATYQQLKSDLQATYALRGTSIGWLADFAIHRRLTTDRAIRDALIAEIDKGPGTKKERRLTPAKLKLASQIVGRPAGYIEIQKLERYIAYLEDKLSDARARLEALTESTPP